MVFVSFEDRLPATWRVSKVRGVSPRYKYVHLAPPNFSVSLKNIPLLTYTLSRSIDVAQTNDTTTQTWTGSAFTTSNTVNQSDPDRHIWVDNCRNTESFAEGREALCVICQKEMGQIHPTVTHCDCQNASHIACFDELVENVNTSNMRNGTKNIQ